MRGADFAIRDRHQSAPGVTKNGPAKGEVLHASGVIGELDGVAHNVLILKYDVETGDDVTHKVLRAETERQAGQTCQRRHGRDVDAELRQGG